MKEKIKILIDSLFKKMGYISVSRLTGTMLIVKEDSFKLEKVQCTVWVNKVQLKAAKDLDSYEAYIKMKLRQDMAERLEPFMVLKEKNLEDRGAREYRYSLYVANKLNK